MGKREEVYIQLGGKKRLNNIVGVKERQCIAKVEGRDGLKQWGVKFIAS
jgi:hypothetical protein